MEMVRGAIRAQAYRQPPLWEQVATHCDSRDNVWLQKPDGCLGGVDPFLEGLSADAERDGGVA